MTLTGYPMSFIQAVKDMEETEDVITGGFCPAG